MAMISTAKGHVVEARVGTGFSLVRYLAVMSTRMGVCLLWNNFQYSALCI